MEITQSIREHGSSNTVAMYLETHPKLGCDVMEHLWNVLDVRYPGIWRSGFRSDKESLHRWKVEWAKAFAEQGITLAMIKRGLDNMVALHEKMPPSLPGSSSFARWNGVLMSIPTRRFARPRRKSICVAKAATVGRILRSTGLRFGSASSI